MPHLPAHLTPSPVLPEVARLQEAMEACRRGHPVLADCPVFAAWDALRDSEDPVVRWVGENLEDFQGNGKVLLALQQLPATPDQLRSFALEMGWCGDFDEILYQAMSDGAFKDYPRKEKVGCTCGC